jgi:Transglutaminase-like superfamily
VKTPAAQRRRAARPRPMPLFLGLRMTLWSAALPGMKRIVPLGQLVRLMWMESGHRSDPAARRRVVELSARLTKFRVSRSRGNCLERSLLAYRYLAAIGADPRLVIGVTRTGGDVAGHAWVTLDGRPIHDDPAGLEGMTPLAEFGRGGVITDPGTAPGVGRVQVWI